jgi:hypothetical protein
MTPKSSSLANVKDLCRHYGRLNLKLDNKVTTEQKPDSGARRKKETKHHIFRAPEPGYSIEEKSAIVTSTFTIRQELNEATDSTS